MDIQKERKAFEKALVDKCGFNPESSFSVDDKGEYKSDATHFGWAMWQAAKAQAVPESNALLSASLDAIQKLGSGDFVLVRKKDFESLGEFKDLYKRAIISAKKRKNQINWAHVAGLGVGSGRAVDLCKSLGIDPGATNMHVVIEAQEPAPLKLGDLVEPIDHRYTLASGCERYPYAYVVNTNPFQLMSEEGDMYWCCTVEAGGYKLIKSNDQLPEAVSLRMIREGLLAPVEAQGQSHD